MVVIFPDPRKETKLPHTTREELSYYYCLRSSGIWIPSFCTQWSSLSNMCFWISNLCTHRYCRSSTCFWIPSLCEPGTNFIAPFAFVTGTNGVQQFTVLPAKRIYFNFSQNIWYYLLRSLKILNQDKFITPGPNASILSCSGAVLGEPSARSPASWCQTTSWGE